MPKMKRGRDFGRQARRSFRRISSQRARCRWWCRPHDGPFLDPDESAAEAATFSCGCERIPVRGTVLFPVATSVSTCRSLVAACAAEKPGLGVEGGAIARFRRVDSDAGRSQSRRSKGFEGLTRDSRRGEASKQAKEHRRTRRGRGEGACLLRLEAIKQRRRRRLRPRRRPLLSKQPAQAAAPHLLPLPPR